MSKIALLRSHYFSPFVQLTDSFLSLRFLIEGEFMDLNRVIEISLLCTSICFCVFCTISVAFSEVHSPFKSQ